jgi:hypothetical protein
VTLFYNIVKGDTPDYLSDLLPLTVNQANNYNLRNANNFTVPYIKIHFSSLFISGIIYPNISEIHLVIAF